LLDGVDGFRAIVAGSPSGKQQPARRHRHPDDLDDAA
jgi:hypothetical protein